MGWGIRINWGHVAIWRRLAILWLGYVGVGLLVGWKLGPRLDEIAFLLLLPLAPLAAWIALSFLWALLRLWLDRGKAGLPVVGRKRRLAAQPHQRVTGGAGCP